MRVVAFNGSPRDKGNTSVALGVVGDVLESQGIATETFQLGGSGISPCKACFKCFEKRDGFCVQSDPLNSWLERVYEAHGLLIGSPVYFAAVTPEVKAFIDRVGLCAIAGGYRLKYKAGAAVVAVRRQGAVEVFNQINSLFALNQMIIPCSTYWNLGVGTNPGDILQDQEGMETFRVLGTNMAWLLKRLWG
ncbi:MAG: flavodoxin family protein [Aquificota bacterium]|nr:MAG: flavodoxin family protein [Aquificota bacterium]